MFALRVTPIMTHEARWLLDWPQAAAAGVAICGGKGWNLGRLARYGFAVPAGGVLVADAYRSVFAQCVTAVEAEELQQLDREALARPATAERLAALQQRLLHAPMPSALEEDLAAFLEHHALIDVSLAIRSSATGEDGEQHSFAGIHASRLGVTGPVDVMDAVRHCYASLWSVRAVAYRRHAGIADADVACAVVICRLIVAAGAPEPAAAGVMFTCDPVGGRRDRLHIDAVAGLADQLVTGMQAAEQTIIGGGLEGQRIVSRTRPDGALAVPFDDGQWLELARWGARIHWALGDGDRPQDIEWAYDGMRFWFVQARPVTRLPHHTFDALHDSAVIWSNANLKEVVAGVPSALSWSLIEDAVRDMLFTPVAAAGYPVPRGMPTLRRWQGRAYFDLSALQWAYYDAFGYLPGQLNRELGGRQPEIDVPSTEPLRGREGLRRVARQLRMMRRLRGVRERVDAAYGDALARLRSLRVRRLDLLTDSELRDLLREWQTYGATQVRLFQFANSAAGLWLHLCRTLLLRLRGDDGEVTLGLLLAGSGGMPSADAVTELATLADVADADPGARTFLAALPATDPVPSWSTLPASSPFRVAFSAYLDRHGHRALNETELAEPRVHETPGRLLREIARLNTATRAKPTANAQARRREAEQRIAALPVWSRPVVRWLARRARAGMACRETGKSLTIVVLEPLRLLALEIGRRMQRAGRLSNAQRVFALTFADIDALLSGTWDGEGADALSADREAQRRDWLTQAIDDVIVEGGVGGVRAAASASPGPVAVSAPALSGIGVSPGSVSAPARLLRDFADGARLGDGEIMVVATTDPGWMPLFLRAGGVVTEIGGYLSHGAIVARELGIPAVVNVESALQRLQDGDLVRLDGSRGSVTFIADATT